MTVNIIDKEKQPITLNEIYEVWYKLKVRYRDAIVVLRGGDNYFSFEEDADFVTGLMQMELLPPWKERSMCILPYHCMDTFLHKVVKAGCRAAICEPLFSCKFS